MTDWTDWIDKLVPRGSNSPPNPHYHCGTLSTEPCPTGVHHNGMEDISDMVHEYDSQAALELDIQP